MYIIPTFHSIIVSDQPYTEEQMYIQHDIHRDEVMGKKRCSLHRTFICPETDVEKALDFLKYTPHPRDIKVFCEHPEAIQKLVNHINSVAYSNHQQYLKTITFIDDNR